VEVGAKALEMGIWGAYKNVMINVSAIIDAEYKSTILATADELVSRAQKKCSEILNILESR
jgi:glutamate formiminotransferase/formiminotetrahydrofolate cyclodeaminase